MYMYMYNSTVQGCMMFVIYMLRLSAYFAYVHINYSNQIFADLSGFSKNSPAYFCVLEVAVKAKRCSIIQGCWIRNYMKERVTWVS